MARSYEDFEISISAGENAGYTLRARSSLHETSAEWQPPYDRAALEVRLKDLQIALLKSGGARRRVLLPQEATVQEFGAALYDSLFAGEVRALFEASLRAARDRGRGLRLRLRFQAPEIAALPWEFLYYAQHNDFVALASDIPIVRQLPIAGLSDPLPLQPPLRILGMVSDPANLPPIDARAERAAIERALAPLVDGGLVELRWVEGRSWRELQRVLRTETWHVLHFVGHGSFDSHAAEGMVYFCDDRGQADPLSATNLNRILNTSTSLRLVVLNACEGASIDNQDIFSSCAATLVRGGIPAVVAMQYVITDRAATEFARSFYEALADGLPVDTALGDARRAISVAVTNTLEWGVPVLFMRAQDGRIFEVERAASRTLPTPPAPAADLPAPPASPEATSVTAAPKVPARGAYSGRRPRPGEEYVSVSPPHLRLNAGDGSQAQVTRQPAQRKGARGTLNTVASAALTIFLLVGSGFAVNWAISNDLISFGRATPTPLAPAVTPFPTVSGTGDSSSAQLPDIPPSATPALLAVQGEILRTRVQINLRTTPNGVVVERVPAGAEAKVLNGAPSLVDGIYWWNVVMISTGISGWLAQESSQGLMLLERVNAVVTPPAQEPTAAPTPEPTPADVEREDVEPLDVYEEIEISTSIFVLGCDRDDDMCEWDGGPRHPVTLDTFFIDKYEVTNSRYAACVEDDTCTPPRSPATETNSRYYSSRTFANFPVVNVDWDQARTFCEWENKRLPTEAEWARAAGNGISTWPWGEDDPSCDLLNFGDPDNNSYCVGEPAPVGYYPDGASPFGVMDMGGNVAEWVADWYQGDYFTQWPARNPTGPDEGTWRVFRGGGWSVAAEYALTARRNYNGPGSWSTAIGFRCVRSE